MFRVPIWMMSAASSTASAFSVSISSVTMPMPVFSRARREDLQAFQAEPLEGIGAGARLERAGAEEPDAVAHQPVGGAEDRSPRLSTEQGPAMMVKWRSPNVPCGSRTTCRARASRGWRACTAW